MTEIIFGSLLLSLIHASIPNHWLPLISIGKAENWTLRQTQFATLVTGFAHTLSTLAIGIIVGYAGVRLSEMFHNSIQQVAAILLIILGIVYIVMETLHNHSHEHNHNIQEINQKGKSMWPVIGTLSLAMFFTPCVEIEAYYFRASVIGWTGILIVSIVYVAVTVCIMLFFTYLGFKGVRKIRLHFLEHHEKSINGIILIALGIFAFFYH